MNLYGRYHSPFVRRVAIWLNLQGRAYAHQPIMVTGDDYERLKTINPMGRVPALQLDDATMLVETFAIIDHLELTAPAEARLLPIDPEQRLGVMQVVACANTLAEKAVALVYETTRRPPELHWAEWIARVEGQVTSALDLLEAHSPTEGFAGGDAPNGADVAAVASFDFVGMACPHLSEGKYRRLAALSARANELDAFSSTLPS